MKMNKKGFTLIELLAVIVILAIIALIATPIILGVIDNARKNSARDAAFGVIDAVRLQYIEQMYSANTTVSYAGSVDNLSLSGTKPESGQWKIVDDGSVQISNVKFGEYKCRSIGDGDVECSRTDQDYTTGN